MDDNLAFTISGQLYSHKINKIGTKLIWLGEIYGFNFTSKTSMKEARIALKEYYEWMDKDTKFGDFLEFLKTELIKFKYPRDMIE